MSGVPASRPLLQPISSAERVQYIDVLRGFALYGVLLANIIWMAHDIVLTPSAARQLPTHAVDRLVKYLVVFFVDGKFVTLFSFLFAVGFTIQMRRALQHGGSGIPMYARRAAVLMVIGVVHLVFVWFGDILFAYSLLGFVLLSMRNWRPGKSMRRTPGERQLLPPERQHDGRTSRCRCHHAAALGVRELTTDHQ